MVFQCCLFGIRRTMNILIKYYWKATATKRLLRNTNLTSQNDIVLWRCNIMMYFVLLQTPTRSNSWNDESIHFLCASLSFFCIFPQEYAKFSHQKFVTQTWQKWTKKTVFFLEFSFQLLFIYLHTLENYSCIFIYNKRCNSGALFSPEIAFMWTLKGETTSQMQETKTDAKYKRFQKLK